VSGLKRTASVQAPSSSSCDATHFTSIKGLLRYENCVFVGQGDDFANIHGYYHAILSHEGGNTYLTQDKAPDGTHSQSQDYPDVGDILELSHMSTFHNYGQYTVVDCKRREEERICEITLDRPLPEDTSNLFLADITRMPRAEIIGCTASRHMANSLKIKA